MRIWSPITCDCKFEVNWPSPGNAEQTFVSLIKKGMEHKKIVNSSELYDICYEESSRRSRVINLALGIHPDDEPNSPPLAGETLFTFYYESSKPPRKMTLDIPTFTHQERDQLRDQIDDEGIDDVEVLGD